MDRQDEKPPVVLQHPFTMLVVGPTGCGKTSWVQQLLMRKDTLMNPPPQQIKWFYRRWQPLYTEIQQQIPFIEFIQGLPPTMKRDDYFNKRYPSLFILDDLMKDATQSTDVCDLFTEGSHHRNLSVICLLQNLYYKGKETHTMSLNTHYMVLFKNPRDQQQVHVLARQMYPGRPHYFMTEYLAATEQPYGYLFVDLKQNTPEDQRLRSTIFISHMYERQFNPIPAHLPFDHQSVNRAPEPTAPEHIYNQPEAPVLCKPNDMTSHVSSCMDCGAMYATSMDLQCHVKRGCPEAESESEDHDPPQKKPKTEHEEMDEDNDYPAFETLINEAYAKYDDKYSEKIDHFVNEGMSEKQAKQEASEALRPQYRKALMKNYTEFLCTLYYMKQSPLHYKVGRAAEEYMEDGKSVERAIRRAIYDHRHLMDEVLDDAENNQSDAENEDDDDTSQEDTD